MLLDSNVIIYTAKPQHDEIRRFIARQRLFVSAISIVEVLGYQNLNSEERIYLERFFETANVLTLSNSVIAQAVKTETTAANDAWRCPGSRDRFDSPANAYHAEYQRLRLDR